MGLLALMILSIVWLISFFSTLYGFSTLFLFLHVKAKGFKYQNIKDIEELKKFANFQKKLSKKFFFYGLEYLEDVLTCAILLFLSIVMMVSSFFVYIEFNVDTLYIIFIVSFVFGVLNFLLHGWTNEILKKLKE